MVTTSGDTSLHPSNKTVLYLCDVLLTDKGKFDMIVIKSKIRFNTEFKKKIVIL